MMNVIDQILYQLRQVGDAIRFTGLVGLGYGIIRARQCIRDHKRAILLCGVMALIYVLSVGVPAAIGLSGVQQRYYYPALPIFLLLSAVGWHRLLQDVNSRRLAVLIIVLLLGGNVIYTSTHLPLRAHRAAESEAGHWLKQYDPEYDGYIWADRRIFAYYSDTKLLRARYYGAVMKHLPHEGREVKYAIFEPDVVVPEEGEKDRSVGTDTIERHVWSNDWELIYKEPERNIHIYRNPEYRPPEGEKVGR